MVGDNNDPHRGLALAELSDEHQALAGLGPALSLEFAVDDGVSEATMHRKG
jgi:hypothetical protein